MSSVKFVNFSAQYRAHRDEYDKAIVSCLNEGKLVLQEHLEAFEVNLAKRLGMKHAIGVANGTDALVLALLAKGVSGVVAVPGYTFKATMEAVYHAGCRLKILDTDESRLMKPTHEPCIPVHIEGTVSHQPNAIIEDGAQAIGARDLGYSGTFTLSFYPAKILGGFGDGGAVLTNDDEVARKVRLLRHHWQTNENEEFAYNSRLDNVQAAFLDVKLKYLDEILARRKEIAIKYLNGLDGVVGLPFPQEGRVWQDFVIRVDEPTKLAEFLKAKGIETLGYGMTPPHKALNLGTLPNTEKLYQEMIRLPLNETLENEQINYVIDSVREFYA
jgi:dTDP-4-amino-4,6-dideoxygalactose transaminase